MPFPRTATPHFVRACEVERHVKISQEPLYTEIYRRNAGAKNRDPHFVWACAVETHVKIAQEPLRTEIYKKNAGAQNPRPILRASLRSRNACQDFTGHFRRKFTGKMLQAKTAPHTLCEPAPSKRMSQEPLCTEIYRKKAGPSDPHFLRACEIETHVKISQEPLDTEICR